eukprot:scaffold230162_cov17-Tisochrysis_lutea.AAC.1
MWAVVAGQQKEGAAGATLPARCSPEVHEPIARTPMSLRNKLLCEKAIHTDQRQLSMRRHIKAFQSSQPGPLLETQSLQLTPLEDLESGTFVDTTSYNQALGSPIFV